MVGLLLIVGSTHEPLDSATDPRLGNLLGVCAGATWALTLTGLRWLASRSPSDEDQPEAAVVAGCFLAAAAAACFVFPLDQATTSDWLIVVYLGVFQIGLAYYFITQGIRMLSALETSLLLLVEPVFAPIWAWLLLAEHPGGFAILGGAVVILATAVYALRSDGLQG